MYPINLKLRGRRCAVIGGGSVALRKLKGLVAEGADVTVIAPEVLPEIRLMAERGELSWLQQSYERGALQDFFMVFCTSDNFAVNHEAAIEAIKSGALVNSATNQADNSFNVPASVHYKHLLLTASSDGMSPAVSRLIREDMEQRYRNMGDFLELAGGYRERLKALHGSSEKRTGLWHEIMNEHMLALIMSGNLEQAEDELKDAINRVRLEP